MRRCIDVTKDVVKMLLKYKGVVKNVYRAKISRLGSRVGLETGLVALKLKPKP